MVYRMLFVHVQTEFSAFLPMLTVFNDINMVGTKMSAHAVPMFHAMGFIVPLWAVSGWLLVVQVSLTGPPDGKWVHSYDVQASITAFACHRYGRS